MYKKYITKKGKKIGPYYYDSVRLKNGKIKTVYLGKNPPEQKKLNIPQERVALQSTYPTLKRQNHHYVLVLFLFVVIGLIFFSALYINSQSQQVIEEKTASMWVSVKNLFTGFAVIEGESNQTNVTIINKEVSAEIAESSVYEVVINAGLEILSVKASGEISGEGNVAVYLGKKDTLVYANNKPSGIKNALTGLVISSIENVLGQQKKFEVIDIQGNIQNIPITYNNETNETSITINKNIKNIIFTGLSGTPLLYDEQSAMPAPENIIFKKKIVIDTSGLDFSQASFQAAATASLLMKCQFWDITNNICLGSWEKVKDIIIGEEYGQQIEKGSFAFAEAELQETQVASKISQASTEATNLTLQPDQPQQPTQNFENECADTCSISITKKKFNLIIELSNASLLKLQLHLGINPQQNTTINTTELENLISIAPVKKTQKITNITSANLLKVNFSNDAAEIVIEKVKKGKKPDLVFNSQAERGPDWIRLCENGKCVHSIYSEPIFILDKDGKYKPITEVVTLTPVDGDTFKVTWWDNEVNITFSGANLLKTEIKEHEDEYEWIYYYNFTSSEHVPFSKIESNKKLEQQGASVVVDGIKISFEDAIERGFDVTPIELDTKTQAFALQIPEENINATLGEVIEIDPVIELQNAPNVTDDAFIRKNMSSVPTYQRFTTQASIETGIFGCATTNFSVRSYYDFNLSSIPDNVVISQVNLTVRIGTIDDDSDMLNATQMNQPGGSYSNDATGNAAAFNDMENISYAQVRVTANSVQSFILGSTANTNLQANLTTGDTFSVGLRTKETGDAFGATCSPFNDRTVTRINSTEDATVASRPKLSVSYDLSPPEVILNAPANNTLFTILGNITLNATVTDKNDALIDEVVFFGDNNALPSSSDILSIQLNVTNGTALTYNWTAPVIQLEGGTTLLLIHFDNRSIFGENTTVVNDYSNYNFDGVIGDAIFNWTTSVLGGAYRFDGTNDNITFGDQDALIGFNRTYLMWINPISVSGTQTILDKLTGGDGFRIDASNSDVIVRSDAETITASNFLNLSTYVHLAITMNATGYTTIYRNGVSHTRGQFTSMSANNVNFILGETASGTQDFNGLLDELAIVNRTYSAIDVRNAFRIGSGIYYWNVNATDGLDYNTSLTFTFNISISDPPTITLNNPPNGTTYTGIGNITLDVTIDDVNQDNLTLELFGTNTTSPLPENLLFRRSSIIPASSFVYNWTAPVLQLDTDYQLLAHLNNQSIFIENNTRVYNFADPTRNGTLEGGMLVNMTGGMLGGALEGRQTNGQYLDFGNQNAWVNLGNLTWMAWVKAYDITGDEGIISKGRTSQIPAADLTVRKVASNLIVETGSTNPINATNFFTVNEWVHFAVVFTNSVNITFYRNGVELNRSTNTSIVGNNDEFVIGNFESTASTFNNPFNGLIDEVAIINRSLTATEVLDAYRLRGNTYNWFGNVTDGTNQISSSQRSFRIDAIPSVSVGPTLTPSPANTTDQFTCTFTVTDTDPNDGLSANISFFNGTRLELSFNISVTKDSQATQTATLGIQAKMENWTCGVVPFDGIAEGNLVNSTNVSVVNSPPTRPTLTNPVNNNVTTDTTPFFNWTPVTDPDNDVINYTLNITCLTTSGGACPTGDDSQQIDNINISNYTMTDDLDFFLDDGFRYNWTVRATDGQNTSSFAQPFNITFVVVVDINLSNSSIDFGSTLSPGDAESTQDRSPAPLKLDNIGNAFVNVNISSNNFLFTTLTSQSTNYMFRINDSGGQLVTPFNTTESIVNFTNVTTTNRTAIVRFNETATANIDINITVPSDEPSGLKTSVLNLVAWYPGR